MNNEVEEFLRRAAQRRAQVESQLRAQAEARARGQGTSAPPPRTEPPKRITPAAQSLSQQQSGQAEVVELAASGSGVAESVAQHMRHSQDIAARVELLGDRVESADEEMAAHLHQTFDHQVGRLRKTTEGPAQPSAATPSLAATVARDVSPAHGIAELLRSPQSVRNAFILAEVLNRPPDRW